MDSLCIANTTSERDILQIVPALLPPNEETQHIVIAGELDGEPTYSIDTKGDVLFAKFSFKLIAEEFDIGYFNLQNDEEEKPTTGIEIQLTENDIYTDRETFRFEDATASDDATLKTLVLSKGETNEDPELNRYKEYELTPTFTKETLTYTRELLEYIDDIDLKIQTNDTKASMKIKVPKRDETGELIFGEDESLQYEEKEITQDETGAKLNIKLNELGKESTKITIIVTSESGKKTNEYEITVTRPFATIKGSVYTAPTAELNKHVADIRIYKSEEVEAVIDLDDSSVRTEIHERLISLNSKDYKTNEDGTYEIYVIPGKYHMLIDKAGYLDHIFNLPELKDTEIQEIGQRIIMAGDANKDGTVNQRDAGIVLSVLGAVNGEDLYTQNSTYDFDESTSINQRDIGYVLANLSELVRIEKL